MYSLTIIHDGNERLNLLNAASLHSRSLPSNININVRFIGAPN